MLFILKKFPRNLDQLKSSTRRLREDSGPSFNIVVIWRYTENFFRVSSFYRNMNDLISKGKMLNQCYQLQTSATVDNTVFDLDNS